MLRSLVAFQKACRDLTTNLSLQVLLMKEINL